MRKQMAVLRELQLAVAQSRGGIFTFPSEYSPSDFAAPSLPTTSNINPSFISTPATLKFQAPPKRQKTANVTSGVAQLEIAAQQTAQVAARPRVQVKFYNGGNWCYLNGLLNLLFSIPRFIEVLDQQDTLEQIDGVKQKIPEACIIQRKNGLEITSSVEKLAKLLIYLMIVSNQSYNNPT